MRVLALLPVHEPPAYLTALAAAGHEIHLVATKPGEVPQPYVNGVAVYTLGYWWRAIQGSQPQVAVSELGDRQAAGIVRKAGRLPCVQIQAGGNLDALDLEAALHATIPGIHARMHAQVKPVSDPLEGSTVKVIAWAHYGIPFKRAGSEVMLHHMMKALKSQGIGVLVVTSEMPEAPESWEVDQVPYMQLPHASAAMLIRRAQPHVVVTHHHLSPQAIGLAKQIDARSALIKHNDHAAQARFLQAEPDLVAYNSRWVRESLRPDWPQVDRLPGLVVHPPVNPAEHHTRRTGQHVTLVNLSANKGVTTWQAVAAALPDVPFLGVLGAHGPQLVRGLTVNTEVIGQTSDMRGDVWARTRVLLMPSVYESYGMVAVEAIASGIPVVAHPTPGLKEALGDAAVFIDRDDHQAWADTVRALHTGGKRRGTARRTALERSTQLAEQTETELKAWVEAVRALAGVPVAS